MSIKRHDGTSFKNAASFKRFDSEKWNTLTIGKRFDGTNWQNILPVDEQKSVTKIYSPISSANYWGSGSKDTQYPGMIIQGSYNGTLSAARRGLIIFNNAQLRSDVGNGTIKSVRLKLKRVNSSHGVSGKASVFVKLHKYTSLPAKWNGDDLGNADSDTPKISRGETVWVTLNNSALQRIINGEAGGFALDADANYYLSGYIKFEKSSTQLEVTFEK